jgi:hypothetical protein
MGLVGARSASLSFAQILDLKDLCRAWKATPFSRERQVLDVKTAEQLQLPRPGIYGGGPEIIKSPKSPALDRIIKSLAVRAERIAERKVSPDKDNMLLITTEGRKAALDPRLVDSSAPVDPEGKISQIVRNLVRFYHESQDTLGVQAVFIGVRLSQSDAERPAALGSEAKPNGDGRAQHYFSCSRRVPFRIFLFYRLANCDTNETTW